MKDSFLATATEKNYLRDLAHEYLELANLPVMEERKKLWYAHNSLRSERPVIVMDAGSILDELMPKPQCHSPAATEIEKKLRAGIVNFKHIRDDKVISPYYAVDYDISQKLFGLDNKKEYAGSSGEKTLGYRQEHPVRDIEDLGMLKPSLFWVDRENTLAKKAFAEDMFGDILPVRLKNTSLNWELIPSRIVDELMGMEAMMYAIIDCPDEMHRLMRRITDELLAFIAWQEKESLLILNNENDYAGAGSYGFTDELPSAGYVEAGKATSRDIWCNMNAQSCVGISPQAFGEFFYPYYHELAAQFGLVYFGCCEPVHGIWEDYISHLPNLRKVSISAWCDEEAMGERLRGGRVIYSRKPSPNYIGVGKDLDEDAFGDHISKTLRAAKGCTAEIIFRDIYTLSGNLEKAGRAIDITRAMVDR